MDTKDMKRCSTMLIIREMQIKTTIRDHFTPVTMAIINKSTITNAGGGAEKRKPSCTVGGNVSWDNHYGEQYGGTLESIHRQNCHMTKQPHSWAYIRTKFSLKKTHAPACSLQHCSQSPRHGNNPDVHR